MNFTIKNMAELRLALATAAKHEVRYYLNGIHFDFTYGRMTSSDGALLVRSAVEITETADLPDEAIITITGTAPKSADRAVFDIDGSAGTVTLYKRADVLKILPAGIIDEKYPGVGRVIDACKLGSTEVASIGLDIKYLSRVAAAAGTSIAKLEFSDGGPIGITLKDLPDSTIRLMPVVV